MIWSTIPNRKRYFSTEDNSVAMMAMGEVIQALGPEASPQDLAAAAAYAVEELPADFRDAYPREEWESRIAEILDALGRVADVITADPAAAKRAQAIVEARRSKHAEK